VEARTRASRVRGHAATLLAVITILRFILRGSGEQAPATRQILRQAEPGATHAAAVQRGVRVRVILDRRARSVNSDAYSYLGSRRVAVTWSSPDYHYTHQKTMIIDGTKAVIMTANLTSRYYATSRDFLVVDTERADVSAISTVFNADFKEKAVRPGDGSDLVWSPTDSQDHLIGLINGATSSLRIYSEEMGDRTVENALIRAARRGVDVQVCGENESGEYDSAFAKLARAGIRISYTAPPPASTSTARWSRPITAPKQGRSSSARRTSPIPPSTRTVNSG
jgi:phosphatidylserine/phosphatidylglycerophosphate/cardiolipin synthase-like enzyme